MTQFFLCFYHIKVLKKWFNLIKSYMYLIFKFWLF